MPPAVRREISLFKKVIFVIITFLIFSCNNNPRISEDYYEIKSKGSNYWVDKDLNDYGREYIVKDLSGDLERFYWQLSNKPLSSWHPNVIFTLGSWNEISENKSLIRIINKTRIDKFYGDLFYRELFRVINEKPEAVSAVYLSPIDTIIVKLNSKYDSRERIQDLLISEYNHAILEMAGQRLTDMEFNYWVPLIDEGLTHFFYMYIQQSGYTLNQEGIDLFFKFYQTIKTENNININKNEIDSAMVGKSVTTLFEEYLSISFIAFLLEKYGLDHFLGFIDLLYFSDYSQLDELFGKSFQRTFKDIYFEWMDYCIEGELN